MYILSYAKFSEAVKSALASFIPSNSSKDGCIPRISRA